MQFGLTLAAAEQVTESTLVASSRWVAELQNHTFADAVKRIRVGPRYRDLTPTQYQYALDWLRRIGLVEGDSLRSRESDLSPAEHVLAQYLEGSSPAWLDEVDGLISRPEELPFDVVELAERIGVPELNLYKVSRQVARKFDDVRLREIGQLGESLLIDWLTVRTSDYIDWVSQTDDTAGHDIRLVGPSGATEVEVKSTTIAHRVTFYLSRNEYRRMRTAPAWCLQIVAIAGLDVREFFYVTNEWVEAMTPRDTNENASWASTRVQVPRSQIFSGLHPEVRKHLTESGALSEESSTAVGHS